MADRPPPIPRCVECNRIVGYQGHGADCSIAAEQRVHFGNVAAVEVALKQAVDRRRMDRPFMERLAARIRTDANILDRLADQPSSGDRSDG